MKVRAWQETIEIPTYKIGEPNKNPMFLEKRVYQGSSGVVYPHPVVDKVFDEKENKTYTALFLENEYLKVMILPELGGRIQMAYDKTNDYHFIYYNQVVKPALVGLAGPWISGGIEFNWPQHHRPSTFEPVDFKITSNQDGSETVWVNEYEKMFGTKCALGFTLHPDKAYIELSAKLHNRTPFPQTFLWWANPAVSVDEHYQSVFPPDVTAVYDHGKRDVSTFPIAKGTYYKVDYSPGTDISVYTNIPVPTSYMAVGSEFNFVGGYHHQKKAGLLHVANRHISPGKKQWTWGCGEFGLAWDKQLTDNDGPYFELMCGMFTDNQPDFSWIMPNEVRTFTQYFMPYKNIGMLKNASIDAAVNFDIFDGEAHIQVYATSQRTVDIILNYKGKTIYRKSATVSPVITFDEKVALTELRGIAQDYHIQVLGDKGETLIEYAPITRKEDAVLDPAKPIGEPHSLATNEDLYLAGLHLEQYRHATYSAEDYYLEALRRDETDLRCNNALGLFYLRKGNATKAENFFRQSINKLHKHNTNPYVGEALYNLGLTLVQLDRDEEAYNYFYKSTWNAAQQDVGYYEIACIDIKNKNWKDALEHINISINRNYTSPKARALKALILRKMGALDQAIKYAAESIIIDEFDYASRYELFLSTAGLGNVSEGNDILSSLKKLMRDVPYTYSEIAIEYIHADQFSEAADILKLIEGNTSDPLIFYYLAYCIEKCGLSSAAYLEKAFGCSPDTVFPNRILDVKILNFAIQKNPNDFKAHYYVGNYHYSKREYDIAIRHWESSVAIQPEFPTSRRNLAIANYNKLNKKKEALTHFELAFKSDTSDSRVLFELDQLHKRALMSPEDRLHFLKPHLALINDRDDLYTEYINLHLITGRVEEGLTLLQDRNFHPWEGGEGKVSSLHIQLHLAMAVELMESDRHEDALLHVDAAYIYPENLGEGKLHGAQENDINYYKGCVLSKLGRDTEATAFWIKSTIGLKEPAQAFFYNDQQPDKIFYQGLSYLKLGDDQSANECFSNLIAYGQKHQNDKIKMDFFAVSLPDLMIFDDDLSTLNYIHCQYLIALGNLGKKEYTESSKSFEKIFLHDVNHSGSHFHIQTILNKENLIESNNF
jgi:Tfp pilus assembly protein PilF